VMIKFLLIAFTLASCTTVVNVDNEASVNKPHDIEGKEDGTDSTECSKSRTRDVRTSDL
jgi:hypothetical protein